nr:MAG TPA: hypothetical protein [Caudoviricetes sp.]
MVVGDAFFFLRLKFTGSRKRNQDSRWIQSLILHPPSPISSLIVRLSAGN